MMSIVALIIGVVASFLVYMGWKQHKPFVALLGWLGFVATIPVWISTLGTEFGLVFGLSLPATFVWLWIFKEQKWQQVKVIDKPQENLNWNAKSIFKNTGLIIHHLILLMLFASLITVALVSLIPIEKATQIAWNIILVPILWGFLSFWHLCTTQKWRAFSITCLGAGASAIYLFTGFFTNFLN